MPASMRILVTGAAGLIGGEVASRLAARGHRVSALVHRNPEVRGNDGAAPPLHEVLHGDVTVPGLGIDPAVAGDHDLLIHCAATTRFGLSREAYRTTNEAGTANVVAAAQAGGMALLHVSTAYVCGMRSGIVLEDDPIRPTGFANGYEASKAAGEALVAASGLRWAIARPSVVVGESASGAIRTFDTIYAAFKLVAEGRVRHMAATADATIDFVPIDYVAAGIVSLAENMAAAAGGTFHLVSAQPVPVATFAAAIGSYPQFSAPALVSPAAFDPGALLARERRLHARVTGQYSSYFQRDPRFDDARFRALTGLVCPPTGRPFLRRLIDYCIEAGFLKGGADQASRSRPKGSASERRTPSARGSR
ncbi:MAG: SDR family oxidoreductase [Novosphingobium sp.]|nr:SDR family oxidoreductase [Novosphingobium sp.]